MSRPHGSWHYPPDWSWFDPHPASSSMIAGLQAGEPPRGPAAGYLYVPDPESRGGWRQWWVYQRAPDVEHRKLGL